MMYKKLLLYHLKLYVSSPLRLIITRRKCLFQFQTCITVNEYILNLSCGKYYLVILNYAFFSENQCQKSPKHLTKRELLASNKLISIFEYKI